MPMPTRVAKAAALCLALAAGAAQAEATASAQAAEGIDALDVQHASDPLAAGVVAAAGASLSLAEADLAYGVLRASARGGWQPGELNAFATATLADTLTLTGDSAGAVQLGWQFHGLMPLNDGLPFYLSLAEGWLAIEAQGANGGLLQLRHELRNQPCVAPGGNALFSCSSGPEATLRGSLLLPVAAGDWQVSITLHAQAFGPDTADFSHTATLWLTPDAGVTATSASGQFLVNATAPVPEPAPSVLLALGLAALSLNRRRRRA